MTKEKFLETFQEILGKAGMDKMISLSENTNELADIMIYQMENSPEYLALDGRPLFQIHEIRNILYRFGEEKMYNYAGTELQIVIELNGDACYVLEFGDQGMCEAMRFRGQWMTDDEQIKDALARHNRTVSKRDFVMNLVWAVFEVIEGSDEVNDSERKEVQKAAARYIQENPADLEFLLFYAYRALQMFVYEEEDLFDIKAIVGKIVHSGYEEEFKSYIRDENTGSDGRLMCDGYYLGLVTAALRLMQEAKEGVTV